MWSRAWVGEEEEEEEDIKRAVKNLGRCGESRSLL